jgi:hypothetical protein
MRRNENPVRTDEEQIVWYRGIRDAAEAQLNLIDEGWRFERSTGTQPRVDVTEEFAARERQTIETMDRLIKMYEARRA